ncbi:MAG: CaiB/BaiF CoA transferase family protein [Hyphomicrobiales bacterium]
MSRAGKQRPLEGIRVLDFTSLLPGPLAGLMLAEAGAEVTKIEPPAGDGMTLLGPNWSGTPALYALLNAGKRRKVVNLKDAAGLSELEPLLGEADVLIEQFRPGVMERLGLGYEILKQRYPGLIYCSITGYGQTGPWAQRAGHDLNYIGDSGILMLAPGAPSIPPVLAADIAGGSYPAVINILLALLQRERTGEGTHIDISMAECMLPFAFWALPDVHLTQSAPRPGGEWITGGSPRYRVYRAGDGAMICIAAIEQKFWEAFCLAIGLDARFASDDAPAEEAIAEVARIIASRDAAHWARAFDKADCCCSVASSLTEAVASPHFAARGVFGYRLENGSGQSMPALPLPLAPQFRAGPDEGRQAPALPARMREGTLD